MATVVYCSPDVLGREPRVWCESELGEESPLEFREGHALVEDDEAAQRLVASRPAIEPAGSQSNPGDPSYFEGQDDSGGTGSPSGYSRSELEDLDYGDIQDVAQALDVPANQSHMDLVDAILEAQG